MELHRRTETWQGARWSSAARSMPRSMPRTKYPRIPRRSTLLMFTGRTSGEARGGAGGAWAPSGCSRAGAAVASAATAASSGESRDSSSAQDDLLANDCAVASITACSSARELNVSADR